MQVTKEKKGNALSVHLKGLIDEEVNFEKSIGPVPKELHVFTKDISRITSFGVKTWIIFFQKLHSDGVKVKFHECSPVIVEQFNLISNFACGGTVESLYIPFLCPKCSNEFNNLYGTAHLNEIKAQVKNVKCPKCGTKANVDEVVDELLAFLPKN